MMIAIVLVLLCDSEFKVTFIIEAFLEVSPKKVKPKLPEIINYLSSYLMVITVVSSVSEFFRRCALISPIVTDWTLSGNNNVHWC